MAQQNSQSELRMRQIVVGEWSNLNGASFSIVGLSTEGKVYKYEVNRNGWVPLEMAEVAPRKKEG